MSPVSTQTLDLTLAAGTVRLLADRAAFLPNESLLLVADAHLGKAQAFRSLGVPVPGGSTAHNLRRLSALIESTQPRELVFLGDLLHAQQGRTAGVLAAVRTWRERHAHVPMRLVRGNHDSRAGDPPADWDMSVVDEPYRVGGWALCHHPQHVPQAHVVAGHLHPGVSLGRGIDRVRLACFHVGMHCSVLPAFGEFTGLHRIHRQAGDRVVLVAEGELRAMPA